LTSRLDFLGELERLFLVLREKTAMRRVKQKDQEDAEVVELLPGDVPPPVPAPAPKTPQNNNNQPNRGVKRDGSKETDSLAKKAK
jgi:hypothetical protein